LVIGSQGRKLTQALALVVGGALDNMDQIVPALEFLGKRHTHCGVSEAHYGTVGAALLWTLEKGLGASWTAETAAAWTAAYTLVAGVMMAAAAQGSGCQLREPVATVSA
jgi:hemoglobin-like flavoprotein